MGYSAIKSWVTTIKNVKVLGESVAKKSWEGGFEVSGLTAEVSVQQAPKIEIFYRSMTDEAAEVLMKTGKMPAGTETFISPTRAFSESYVGKMFEFHVKAGTTAQLESIGVRNAVTNHPYKHLPLVSKGWKKINAFFKVEGVNNMGLPHVNIGLGNGKALDIFNSNIINFTLIR